MDGLITQLSVIGWWGELDSLGVEGGAFKILFVSFTRVAHLATGCLPFQHTL